MPNVVKCWAVTRPSGASSGSRPSSYRVTFAVETDVMCDFETALQEGRKANGTFEGKAFERIPAKGDYYRWTNQDGTRAFNKSALALDFRSVGDLNRDGTVHLIEVGFRPPTPGAEEEPWRVNKHPFARRPYYWIEYYTVQEEVFESRNVIDIGPVAQSGGESVPPLLRRPKNTPGSLSTSAGEETEIATDETLHMVFCSQRNVAGPNVGAVINALYESKLNSKLWIIPEEFWNAQGLGSTTFGRKGKRVGVRPNQARFLRAEVSQYAEFWEGQPYYQMISRVRVAARPFWKWVPDRGVLRYEPGNPGRVVVNRDNDNVVQKVNLDRKGLAVQRNVPFLIPYKISGERPFDSNLGFV